MATMPEARYSDYDRFAGMYNEHWGQPFAERVLPIVDRLLLRHLPANARVLDVCCGTGQLAQALVARGYRVTGVEGSEEMLRFARQNAPGVEFILEDARAFQLSAEYDGALSTYDSLNHIMSLGELASAFRNVHAALVPGGRFMFDLNMEDGYKARWRGSYAIVRDDHVCIVVASYGPNEKVGRNDITMFRREGTWKRSDLTLRQRCYAEEDVRSALKGAGFAEVQTHDGRRDLNLSGDVGRTFFACRARSGRGRR